MKITEILHINRRSAFFKIFLITSSVVMIPIFLMNCLFYAQAISNVTTQSQEIDRKLLEETRDSIELVCRRLKQQAAALADSDDVIRFVYLKNKTDLDRLLHVTNSLASLKNTIIRIIRIRLFCQ